MLAGSLGTPVRSCQTWYSWLYPVSVSGMYDGNSHRIDCRDQITVVIQSCWIGVLSLPQDLRRQYVFYECHADRHNSERAQRIRR